jgi:electron transfer flavoprotein alpha subunit
MKIVIYGESRANGISPATKELLAAGRKLCTDTSGELAAVFINGQGAAPEAISHGADKVYTIDHRGLTPYEPDAALSAMEAWCASTDPDVLLFAHVYPASDLARRLAFRLTTSLTADCIDLAMEPGTKRLHCSKPIYGGNIIAVYATRSRPWIATVREKVFQPADPIATRTGEIIPFAPSLALPASRVTSLKKVIEEYEGKRLEAAEVIVCGGRGMGTQEEFSSLSELAGLLDGALGGSRPTVEKGWIHSRFQVGLTGVRVRPKLYIAVGISGSIQHIAGVVGAKTIVAINKDPEANIFKEAHYGVVGDHEQVLPAFKERLREHLGKK